MKEIELKWYEKILFWLLKNYTYKIFSYGVKVGYNWTFGL